MANTTRNQSLFDRLGGMPAITAAVEKFYERVLADAELSPFFTRTNLVWLRKRQGQFLAQALGGAIGVQGQGHEKGPRAPGHQRGPLWSRGRSFDGHSTSHGSAATHY